MIRSHLDRTPIAAENIGEFMRVPGVLDENAGAGHARRCKAPPLAPFGSIAQLSEVAATNIGEFTQAHLAPRILDEECDGTSPQEARPTIVRVPHARW